MTTTAWNGGSGTEIAMAGVEGAAWGALFGMGGMWWAGRAAAKPFVAPVAAGSRGGTSAAASNGAKNSSKNSTTSNAPRAAGAGAATSAANGARLKGQLIGQKIAFNNHSFRKHVIEQKEFPWIKTRNQYAQMISDVVYRGQMRTFVNRKGVTTKHAWWHNGVVVIWRPGNPNGSTAFRAPYSYFMTKINA
jgi:hypothetical protein